MQYTPFGRENQPFFAGKDFLPSGTDLAACIFPRLCYNDTIYEKNRPDGILPGRARPAAGFRGSPEDRES